MSLSTVPVDPDQPTAKDWLVHELAKAEYQQAKPSWVDSIVKAFWDWLSSLKVGAISGPPALAVLIVIGLLVVAVVVAILVFGVPRLNRRSAIRGELFGISDVRTAAQLRAAAGAAADRGDYATAIAEAFRALARSLSERTIVETSPGTTAHGFATQASVAFPESAAQLELAANAFDGVRYLGHEGARADYESLRELDRQLRAARAESLEVPG